MSAYTDKQERFSVAIAMLILYAKTRGYGLAFDRAGASKAANAADGGHPKSLHLDRLAVDFVLRKDGITYRDGTGHDELHDWWDASFPEAAERVPGDYGHYAFSHNGMR